MTDEQQQAYDLQQSGMSRADIATSMGLSMSAVKRRLSAARKWADADPAVASAAKAGGLGSPSVLGNFWKIAKDENGNGYALHIKNPDIADESYEYTSAELLRLLHDSFRQSDGLLTRLDKEIDNE